MAYPVAPEDGYEWEKLFSERTCRPLMEDFGLTTRVGRFHAIYGPHGTRDRGPEKVPAATCRKVIEAKLSGNHEIEIWADGSQTRTFNYIEDGVDGIMRIFWGDYPNPLNLGTDHLVSINEFVDVVESIAGITLERSYNLHAPKKSGDAAATIQ